MPYKGFTLIMRVCLSLVDMMGPIRTLNVGKPAGEVSGQRAVVDRALRAMPAVREVTFETKQ